MKRFIIALFVVLLLLAAPCAMPVAASSSSRPVEKEKKDVPELSVLFMNNRIRVANATVGSRLEVYSVVGIKVAELEMKQSSGEYSLNIAKGYYIVRIGEAVFKIAVR